jgi:hypothetical protein
MGFKRERAESLKDEAEVDAFKGVSRMRFEESFRKRTDN